MYEGNAFRGKNFTSIRETYSESKTAYPTELEISEFGVILRYLCHLFMSDQYPKDLAAPTNCVTSAQTVGYSETTNYEKSVLLNLYTLE